MVFIGRPRVRYELPSSSTILLHDDGSVDERVYLNLLAQAQEKMLPSNAKILVTGRTVDMRFKNIDSYLLEDTLRCYTTWLPLSTLRDWYMQDFGVDFSIEQENKRNLQLSVDIEKSYNFPVAMGMFMQSQYKTLMKK